MWLINKVRLLKQSFQNFTEVEFCLVHTWMGVKVGFMMLIVKVMVQCCTRDCNRNVMVTRIKDQASTMCQYHV
jgi:hypothetical protein